MNVPMRFVNLQPLSSHRIKHYPQVCPILISLVMLVLGLLSVAVQYKLYSTSLHSSATEAIKAFENKDLKGFINGLKDAGKYVQSVFDSKDCIYWPYNLIVYKSYVGYFSGAVLAATGLFGLLAPIVKIEAMPAFMLVGCLISMLTLACQASISWIDAMSVDMCGHPHLLILFIAAIVGFVFVFISSTIACHFVCCNCCSFWCCPCLSPKELRSAETPYHDLQSQAEFSEMSGHYPV